AHRGGPPTDAPPQASERVAVGSVPPRGREPTMGLWFTQAPNIWVCAHPSSQPALTPIQNASGLSQGPAGLLRARLRGQSGALGWKVMPGMKRRDFITLLGGATITSPWAASAQQRAIPLVGLLSGADPVGYAAQLEGLRLGLLDHGLVEGRTIRIEYRWAESKYDRLPALAADLLSRG